ncbi:hypothetical protein Pmani_004476 [Petrolisthes manimaculis]|uniref:P/Homo B domain-containing protein n=1 Tax=Petrolisthes manimaculis TaxID=1843537 RepID=A0AAE1QE10_9EUCA|nr:hypothetical protein Pmani_004476 [Petrolisthes manimaculis]
MATFIYTFTSKVDLACPSKSRPASFSHLPKPPWGPLIYVLLLNLSLLVVLVAEKVDNSEEHRHRGALYLSRGRNIHTLSWVVDITEGCSIYNVTGDIRKKNFGVNRLSSKIDGYAQSKARLSSKQSGKDVPRNNKDFSHFKSCGGTLPLKLMVLKQLTFSKNTYVIGHPYLKVFMHERRKWKSRYKRSLQSFHLAQTYNSNTFSPSVFTLNRSERGSLYSLNVTIMPNTIDLSGQKRTLIYQPPHSVPESKTVFQTIEKCVEMYLASHPCVSYAQQEVLRPRKKRGHVDFADPLFEKQWHLRNTKLGQYDLNVVGVWESGITGRGVTVCVIDDGLEWRHPDLRDNYNHAGSYDLNADDSDPSPVKNGENNEHGTRCAGEIAAVANGVCGVGVAYRANISGIRVLGGRMTDSMEAKAFVHGLDVNDIYSCSWGPDDDGRTVDGPHTLARRALEHGITHGRSGYGAVYVVASGNGGGHNKDNCNFDGYANSVYTMTIGAVDCMGRMPYYAEECAAMLAVTPSSGCPNAGIVTTDWRESNPSWCTSEHSGTSAAAPLAAAVVALAFEVHPCLSWRDVQYLIALTSRKIDVNVRNSHWTMNAAGLHHSHKHGFGLVDAAAMVSAAAVWESVPFSTTYASQKMEVGLQIKARGKVKEKEKEMGTVNKSKESKEKGREKGKRTQHESERNAREKKEGFVKRIVRTKTLTKNRENNEYSSSGDGKEGISAKVRDREIYRDSEGVKERDKQDKSTGTPTAQIKDEKKKKGESHGVWPAVATHVVDEHTLEGYALATLEFVQVVVNVKHQHRGSLRVELECPSGTRSTLATPRAADNSTEGLVDWALGTVRCWGEDAKGRYVLRVGQEGHPEASGQLLSWRLILHGSPMSHIQFHDRRILVSRAVRGEVVKVNRSALCHQPELRFRPFAPLPPRWLKMLVITGVFLVFVAVFSSLEYIFCHNEEKRRLYTKLRDVAAGRAYYHPRRNGQGRPIAREGGERGQGAGEEGDMTRELEEEEESLLVTMDGDGRESVSLVSQKRVACSPSPSCDADVSSMDDEDDGTDDDAGTSDTVVPRDTTDAATDLTNDEFMSEADDDSASRGGSGGGAGLRGH